MTADANDAAAFVDEGGSSPAVGGRTFGAEDLRPLIFAPPGDVDGPIVPIDWDPTATDRTGKGCAVTHLGDLPANAIVVVRSGDCLRPDAGGRGLDPRRRRHELTHGRISTVRRRSCRRERGAACGSGHVARGHAPCGHVRTCRHVRNAHPREVESPAVFRIVRAAA